MARKSTKSILLYALTCAIRDQEGLADACGDATTPAGRDALAWARAFRELHARISPPAAADPPGRVVHMFSISRLFEEHPEMFVHGDGCECKHCRQKNA